MSLMSKPVWFQRYIKRIKKFEFDASNQCCSDVVPFPYENLSFLVKKKLAPTKLGIVFTAYMVIFISLYILSVLRTNIFH